MPNKEQQSEDIILQDNTPSRASRLLKGVRKSHTPSKVSDSSKQVLLEDEEEEEKKVTHKTKKRGVNTVMQIKKPRRIEPWKVDPTKDKQRFLGVVWKNSTPVEHKDRESELLLVDTVGDQAILSDDVTDTDKQIPSQKSSQVVSKNLLQEPPTSEHLQKAINGL